MSIWRFVLPLWRFDILLDIRRLNNNCSWTPYLVFSKMRWCSFCKAHPTLRFSLGMARFDLFAEIDHVWFIIAALDGRYCFGYRGTGGKITRMIMESSKRWSPRSRKNQTMIFLETPATLMRSTGGARGSVKHDNLTDLTGRPSSVVQYQKKHRWCSCVLVSWGASQCQANPAREKEHNLGIERIWSTSKNLQTRPIRRQLAKLFRDWQADRLIGWWPKVAAYRDILNPHSSCGYRVLILYFHAQDLSNRMPMIRELPLTNPLS